ncbi:SET domain-containing protein-lysine N-methyltransferase [Patescibacteria group bacterium]|nr:SET domain-containing protein-lysine N-methyltransferase [Patescibacteria group bacterium]
MGFLSNIAGREEYNFRPDDKWVQFHPYREPDLLDSELKTDTLEIKNTGNDSIGKGLFARKHFKNRKEVFVFDGKKGKETDERNFIPSARTNQNAVVVGREEPGGHGGGSNGEFIYATPPENSPLRFLNHSCKPNTTRQAADSFQFISTREIQPGEQLTADYSLLETNPEWEMTCNCGSEHCRKIIKSVDCMPVEYLAENWNNIPMYMREWAIENSTDLKIKAQVEKDGVSETTRNFLNILKKTKNL